MAGVAQERHCIHPIYFALGHLYKSREWNPNYTELTFEVYSKEGFNGGYLTETSNRKPDNYQPDSNSFTFHL